MCYKILGTVVAWLSPDDGCGQSKYLSVQVSLEGLQSAVCVEQVQGLVPSGQY